MQELATRGSFTRSQFIPIQVLTVPDLQESLVTFPPALKRSSPIQALTLPLLKPQIPVQVTPFHC